MDDATSISPAPRVNRLGRESSAYLRQHMHNPVDWYPWGDEAFSRAKEQDRPLLISIGYSACHWCHVMERESFENAETAALMNELFVNIKVDREERPDVDQIYMNAVMRLTGHGGWPLTVFCTPDGRPFYGGTYFPPEPRHHLPAFDQVLRSLDQAYRQRNEEVEETARSLSLALEERPGRGTDVPPGSAPLLRAARELLQHADSEHGGFGDAPKFPTPTNLDLLLLAVDFASGDLAPAALGHVVHSCREMSRRGLIDHLGGGFHRYCVDAEWTIPHFEKMLYDQGLLLGTFAEAWRRSDDDELIWPIRETAGYLRRELRAPDGGYFASQDADSEGEEGRFYVWRPREIEAVLGSQAEEFCRAYSVSPKGNFEDGRTHLFDLARQPRERFAAQRGALLEARQQRVPPSTDRKRVAAWNAYAISGLARAGSLLGDETMLDDARSAADFVLTQMVGPDGTLMRVFDAGRATVSAFLDDHAALQTALLDLYRAGVGDAFLAAALHVSDQIVQRFFDEDAADLFLTACDAQPLIHRPRSDHDGATPHAAGLALLGLLRAASLSGRSELLRVVERVLQTHADPLERAPRAFPTLARAAALLTRGLTTVVIVGEANHSGTAALADRARRSLLPEDAVLFRAAGAKPPECLDPAWLQGREALGGAPTAYLCRGSTCSLPVTEPESLAALCDEHPPTAPR